MNGMAWDGGWRKVGEMMVLSEFSKSFPHNCMSIMQPRQVAGDEGGQVWT